MTRFPCPTCGSPMIWCGFAAPPESAQPGARLNDVRQCVKCGRKVQTPTQTTATRYRIRRYLSKK